MAERSFKKEVEKLRLGAGQEFRGEGILAVTKALLQSGVAYLGGYQGAPISHLMDVFADAVPLLEELGVHFEQSASEAAAAAMLAASVNYPLRGAVSWKSVVGTNVASDALSNVASGGVRGGAMIIIGEDYGEGSSIMQERTHAFAMKSQMWLLDPRPHLPKIVEMVERGFELSEASNTPVMLELRIRACHVYGRFIAKDNRPPAFRLQDAMNNPVRDTNRIVLPPANFLHEIEKIERRLPAAIRWLEENRLNEFFGPAEGDVGIIVQGGIFNTLMRALYRLGLADIYGNSRIPIYVMNVTYPYLESEIAGFCADKRAVLMVEEGQPEFIEQALNHILRRKGLETRVFGKDVLPMPVAEAAEKLKPVVPPRPAGFCTGCPERPIFSAMKILEREMGPVHVSCDIGCHLFSILPPFNIGNTTMGYGLGWAGASAFNVRGAKRTIAVMGDGGFWHNGLNSGVVNAVFNRNDNILLVVDNNYSAATGGQDLPSSRADNPVRSTKHPIEEAVKGVGVKWVRRVRSYDVARMKETLREALTTPEEGPKIVIAEGECMLNRQRRERPQRRRAIAEGRHVVEARFGVDAETCTGDHSCIRLSGCPSLTIRANPDPLREDPVAFVDETCVGCGNCGEVAHAAVLCPSFHRRDIHHNPGRMARWWHAARRRILLTLAGRDAPPAEAA